MKQFKLTLNLSDAERADSNGATLTDKQIFIKILTGAAVSAYKDGLGHEFARRFYNICNKIEAGNLEALDFEDAEFGFIKEAMERGKFHPSAAKAVIQVLDAVDSSGKSK